MFEHVVLYLPSEIMATIFLALTVLSSLSSATYAGTWELWVKTSNIKDAQSDGAHVFNFMVKCKLVSTDTSILNNKDERK